MDYSAAVVSFLASSVEMVEALTIVLAAGVSRGWRSSLAGAAAALVVLLAGVSLFGVAILRLVPIDVLRVVLGLFLLLFGLKWLKKAMQRAAGRKPQHAEDAIFAHQVQVLGRRVRGSGWDAEGFATSFNGTLLEGLEVALIVVAVGSASPVAGALSSAAMGSLVAFAVVAALGVALRSPLSRVPENLIKYVVGIMLTTFGSFWAGEGLGVAWPGKDLSLPLLALAYLGVSLAGVALLRPPAHPATQATPVPAQGGRTP